MKKKIFIDGEEGTTGLELFKKLSKHPRVEILRIEKKYRKNFEKRQKLMSVSDLTFLCLPDEAARNAVCLADELGSNRPILIDASTAHRTSKNWIYGLPELNSKQKKLIAKATKISVPGCYATGANVLINPLIRNSIISKNLTLVINAISGFSGGGKTLIKHFENELSEPFFYYGLKLNHKHLPEIKFHNKLKQFPIFMPSVANFFQGMIVNIPLHKRWINKKYNFDDVEKLIKSEYKNHRFIKVQTYKKAFSKQGFFRPDKVLNSNNLYISVFKNELTGQLVLSSNFDNLGKGASGAAIQCMNIVFGFAENMTLE